MAFLFIVVPVLFVPTLRQVRPAPTIASQGLVISEAPVKPRAIVLTIVAFLLGALAAGSIGVRVIREVETAEGATSLPAEATTTTAPQVSRQTYQVDPFESVISSTALIPTGLTVVDTQFAIEYEIETLVPHEGVEPIVWLQGTLGGQNSVDPEDFDHIWPRSWVVATGSDEFVGETSNPDARVARIEVDEGFSPSEVRRITVTEALAPYSVSVPFTVSLGEPTAEVYPGVTMELVGVSQQGGGSAIVQVQISRDDPETTGFFIIGDGPGWRSAVFQAEGAPIVNLTWVGGELPEDIPLVANGGIWLPVDGEFEISLEGLL